MENVKYKVFNQDYQGLLHVTKKTVFKNDNLE